VEDTVTAAFEQLVFKPYGLTALAIDDAALHTGTILVRRAKGIMPDGLPFDMPDSDALPEARDVAAAFLPTQLTAVLYLAVPPHRADAPNVGGQDGGLARYVVERRVMRDAVSGDADHPVELGRKTFRLLLEHEPRDDVIALPVARLRRDGAGHFAVDHSFVPPCTKISGSRRLIDLLTRTVTRIDEKGDALASERDASRRTMADYASHEVANFWLLHTLRSNSSLLHHHLSTRESHPERVFLDLARLVGALSTFALDTSPRDVPLYDHDRLTDCFGELERLLQSRLQVVVPSSCLRFPLAPAADNLFSAAVTDERCFTRARWIVGLRSSAADAAVISRAPSLLKVCSRRYVLELVKRSRAGMSLTHLPAPPPAISPRADTHYFSVALTEEGPAGVCWRDVRKTGELGVHVPDAFPGAEVDLLVLMED
jgi:type VI secretion system protein ImpJ